jgi:hypothetical protein
MTAGPRLNPDQPQKLQALRERENALLDRYGWVDREQGIARIPIQRAIAILADEGLTTKTPMEKQPDEDQ